jgi:hypothetical protein
VGSLNRLTYLYVIDHACTSPYTTRDLSYNIITLILPDALSSLPALATLSVQMQ